MRSETGSVVLDGMMVLDRLPASRRSLVWAGVLLIMNVATIVAAHVLERRAGTPAADLVLFDQILVVWSAAIGLCALAAVPAARAGREARWTAGLAVFVYTLGPITAVYFFNTAALLAFIPVVVLLAMTFFDERLAVGALLWIITALAGSIVLEVVQVLPPAYKLSDLFEPRTIAYAEFAMERLMSQTFILATVLCVVTLAGRRRREATLLQELAQLRGV